MKNKYIKEIDGLRAISVLLVLSFHLNPTGFLAGGYVGVDVFFVISGYLITGIIYRDIVSNSFNYFRFLNRRIARLYPALLFTILLVLIAGFLIYNSYYYTQASKIISYVLFSISNINFMQQKGYWDVSSKESPLMHTWSLGVEQQFYLFFPLLLYFAYKLFKTPSSITVTTIIVTILSLICAQFLSLKYPEANFYFTLSRLFELSIGGLFAITGKTFKKIKKQKKELLLSLGLLLILGCAFFI